MLQKVVKVVVHVHDVFNGCLWAIGNTSFFGVMYIDIHVSL